MRNGKVYFSSGEPNRMLSMAKYTVLTSDQLTRHHFVNLGRSKEQNILTQSKREAPYWPNCTSLQNLHFN